ncbi:ABC transporter permease subunit [Paenarthrobacter sp. Z7-10]|uniref:ABC transporter permease subunit n=1 Tax=Paenarthrobacter sp. Z7-10 TaxID=2787635 RepID=UPI0022A9BEFE|nr:ABC transporter permease subunit [Paenarthrobacter sp. Z7-10]MCZ2402128.1 ABC transporter permease subunit [Paenarthrobacter sp. Z7-10]
MSATTATSPRSDSAVDRRRKPLPVFGKVFSDTWRSLAGWAAGLAAVIFLYLPLFPSIGGSDQMQQLINSMPPQLVHALNYDQIGTGAGYTQSTLFGLMGFLLTSIAAVGWGAGAIGGDEESGQLELTLAHSVTRTQVALERFLALVVKLLILATLVFVLVAALNGPAQLQLDTANLLGCCLLFAGLSLLSGTAALLAGASTGRRIWGVGVGAAVAVLGYVFNAVGNQSPDVEWLHRLSPYYWAYGNNPMNSGANPLAVVALFGLAVLMGALTAMVLRRRDVGV